MLRTVSFILFLLLVWAIGTFVGPEDVASFVETHQGIASMYHAVLFFGLGLLYAVAFGFTIPITTILSLAIGLLYGFTYGIVLVMGATLLGGVGTFLLGRYVFPSWCSWCLGKKHESIVEHARTYPISFLLSTRFFPLVPFPLAHLVPAVAGIRLRDFIWTTLAGTLPASIAFVALGTQVRVIARDGFENIWLYVGLVGLSLTVLIPVLWRQFRGKKSNHVFKSEPL